jgi:allantoicase
MVTKTNNSALLSQLSSISSTVDVHALDSKSLAQEKETPTTELAKNVQPKSPYSHFENLASAADGAKCLFATDEWFACADNLLNDGPPIFVDDLYCEQGKVMDGWESRRRREAGHDWCILQLSDRAELYALEIDTAHFTGNNTPMISIQLADLSCEQETALVSQLPGALDRLLRGGRQGHGHTPDEVAQAEIACHPVAWNEVLPKTPLRPGYEATRMHYFTLPEPMVGTHLRVNYYPDGGCARLRVWGVSTESHEPPQAHLYLPITTGRTCTVVPHSTTSAPPSQQPYEYPELSSEVCGGIGVACSNQHYGTPSNLIHPTLGQDMGDGWETARHPNRPSVLVTDQETGLSDTHLSDWAILKLGKMAPDGIARIILDTKHFRGNYPESVKVEGCFAERGVTDEQIIRGEQQVEWYPLLGRTRMSPDSEHVFDADLQQVQNATRAVTHVRVSIFPDGGISRVRIYGKPLDVEEGDDIARSNL